MAWSSDSPQLCGRANTLSLQIERELPDPSGSLGGQRQPLLEGAAAPSNQHRRKPTMRRLW